MEAKTLSHALICACDDQNIEAFDNLIKNVDSKILKDLNTLDKCLEISVGNGNLELVSRVAKAHYSIHYIDVITWSQMTLGLFPESIRCLQNYCSPQLIAHAHQFKIKNKKSPFYVVSPTEEDTLYQLRKLQTRTDELRQPFKFLKAQTKLNDALIEASCSDQRYLLSQLLNRSSDLYKLEHPMNPRKFSLEPSQPVLNQCLIDSLLGENTVLSDFLTIYTGQEKLYPDNASVDEAFMTLVETTYFEDSIHWCLFNTHGYKPTQRSIDSMYEHCLLQLWRHQATDPRLPRSRNQRERLQQKEDFSRLERILEMISLFVSPHKVDEMLRKKEAKERAREREARIQNFFRRESQSIHQYSAARVNRQSTADNRSEVLHPANEGVNRDLIEGENNDEGVPMEVLDGDNIDNHGEEEVAPRASVHRRRTLNTSVLEHIQRRVSTNNNNNNNYNNDNTSSRGTMRIFSTVNDVLEEMMRLVEMFVPVTEQERAVRLLGRIVTRNSLPVFSAVLSFLHMFHVGSFEIWVIGFLGEAVLVHSCVAGALERAVTGLRGIDDEELNDIFRQAEGPQLLRIFLKEGLNIFDQQEKSRSESNCRRLVEELTPLGLRSDTRAEDFQGMLERYCRGVVEGYGLDYEENEREVKAVTEIITDCYESHVQPFISG